MKVIKIYEHCRFVSGYRRGIIYDLDKEKYFYIPNILCEIANKFDKKSLADIIKFYGKENENHINNYVNYLIENNFAFFDNYQNIKNYLPLNLNWEQPYQITNAIIDIDSNSKFNFENILYQFDEIGCNHIQIRSYIQLSIKEIINIVKFSNNSAIKTIDLIVKFNGTPEKYASIFEEDNRINSLIFHTSPDDKVIIKTEFNNVIISTIKKEIKSPVDFQIIDPAFFNVNLPLYTESMHFNAYYNRKIAIDSNGNIKNCTAHNKSFGNISNNYLIDVINKNEFQYIWNVKKDKIKVCKDCEHRYMCIDSRLPKLKNNSWYYETECNYNPYIAKWQSDDGYYTVKNWFKINKQIIPK